MNQRSILSLALKIIGILMIVRTLSNIPSAITMYVWMKETVVGEVLLNQSFSRSAFSIFGGIYLRLLFGILFVTLSDKVAALVIPADRAVITSTGSLFWNEVMLFRLGIRIVGLVLIAGVFKHIASMGVSLTQYYKFAVAAPGLPFNLAIILDILLGLGLGVYCLTGGRRIIRLAYKDQTDGNSS